MLIHQPHGGVEGQTADVGLAASEFAEMRDRMIAILVRHTGQPEAPEAVAAG